MTATLDGTTFGVGTLVAARGREWVVLPQSEPPAFLVLRPLGGGDDEVAAVFPALEQVMPATFRRQIQPMRVPQRAPGCCAPLFGSASGPAPGRSVQWPDSRSSPAHTSLSRC